MMDSSPPSDTPSWLRIARTYKGIREVVGDRINPMIADMFTSTRFPIAKLQKNTAWCAALVCHCYARAGIPDPPHSARAADLATYGIACEPRPGALIVLAPGVVGAGNSGHVGFWEGPMSASTFWLFSGNCMNTAKSHVYPRARILACRWPASVPLP